MRICDWSSDVGSSDLWSDVVIVAPGEYFPRYEFVRAPKRKGGRVYIDVAANGEVAFYEGYVTSKEAKRIERGEKIDTGPKVPRPEVTGTMQTYIDLHRHAAVRTALTCHPKVALRLMVAHAIAGRSEEHTSELQSLMRISYAVFCLKKKKTI